MLCSTTTTGKSSGPSWLDRLRSSKGFPLHHPDLDLDHFLNPNPNLNPNPTLPTLTPHLPDEEMPDHVPIGNKPIRPLQQKMVGVQKKEQKEELFDLMSSVLAELFNMGGPGEYEGGRRDRKTFRKQLNPKICVLSAPASGEGSFPPGKLGDCSVPAALSPPSADNSTVAGVKKRSDVRQKPGRKVGTSGSGSADSDLVPCSKTEVTVIDTSCSPDWKSEKLIIRKGSVWKVRDKKLWNLSRKKRKLSLVERLIGGKESEQLSGEPGEVDRRELSAPSSEDCTNNVRDGTTKGSHDDSSSIAERRLHFSRSRRPTAKDSIILHSRNTAGRKSGASCATG